MSIEVGAYDWDIEKCRAYAEQLRDKTRANTAEHAAQAIEWLLAQLASHQIIGKNQEPMACQHKRYSIDVTEQIGTCIDCGSEGRMRFVVDDTHSQKREWVGLTDDPENTLHWHALNYRTAPPQNAQKMFEALETFVRKFICETENRNIAKAEKREPACPHIDEPLGCYRVRCQLGRKCVDAQSQPKAEKQEPVAQPKREWVGLTDDEIEVVSGNYTESEGFKHGARWALEQLDRKAKLHALQVQLDRKAKLHVLQEQLDRKAKLHALQEQLKEKNT